MHGLLNPKFLKVAMQAVSSYTPVDVFALIGVCVKNQPGFQRHVLTDARIDVYQFTVVDKDINDNQISKRWGTLEGIKRIGGSPLLETKTMVPKSVVGHEHHGLTDKDFVPDTSW